MSPRRQVPVKGTDGDNASRNRAAVKKLDACQIETGMTAEELIAKQREMKARVLERYGIEKAA